MAKKSKYADLVKHLPRYENVDPTRKDALDELKIQIKAPPNGDKSDSATLSPGDRVTYAEGKLNEGMRALELLLEVARRSAAGPPHAVDYAHAYAFCRKVVAELDALGSQFGLLVEAYQHLMVNQFEVEGVTALRLDTGQPISTWEEPYSKVEDPAKFLEWVKADPDLSRKLSLQWGITNALTKARLLAGESEPPGVTCYALTKVRLGSE